MFQKLKSIIYILRRKNQQIKEAVEKAGAAQSANVILSAYIAVLVDKHGAVRIPKKTISEALGKYKVTALSEGEDYVIEVSSVCESGESCAEE